MANVKTQNSSAKFVGLATLLKSFLGKKSPNSKKNQKKFILKNKNKKSLRTKLKKNNGINDTYDRTFELLISVVNFFMFFLLFFD